MATVKISVENFNDIFDTCESLGKKKATKAEFMSFMSKNFGYKVEEPKVPYVDELMDEIDELNWLKKDLEKSITNKMTDEEFDKLRKNYYSIEADIQKRVEEIERRNQEYDKKLAELNKEDIEYCSKLYNLYLDKANKKNFDPTDFLGSIENFKNYWNQYAKVINLKGYKNVEKLQLLAGEFSDFVLKSGYETTAENLGLLFKIMSSKYSGTELTKKDRDAIIATVSKKIDENHSRINSRKRHNKRDAIIKKGGSAVTAITTGAIGGVAGAVTATMAGAKLLTASLTNAMLLGGTALVAGAVTAAAAIALKNKLTKVYYHGKNIKFDDMEKLADGEMSVEDVKSIKLLTKVEKTSHKIMKLKEHSNKNIFARLLRHGYNVLNRNRIHCISDELKIINSAIKSISTNTQLTAQAKIERIQPLDEIRRRIAESRRKDLINSLAFSLTTGKEQKMEDIDIYARDILNPARKKDMSFVDATMHRIIEDALKGETAKLAGLKKESDFEQYKIDMWKGAPLLEEGKRHNNEELEQTPVAEEVAPIETPAEVVAVETPVEEAVEEVAPVEETGTVKVEEVAKPAPRTKATGLISSVTVRINRSYKTIIKVTAKNNETKQSAEVKLYRKDYTNDEDLKQAIDAAQISASHEVSVNA